MFRRRVDQADPPGEQFLHHALFDLAGIDAIRSAAVLAATNWTDGSSLVNVAIKAQHITQMRDQLDAALTQLGLPSNQYTPLTAYVRAQDISEVRAHVK